MVDSLSPQRWFPSQDLFVLMILSDLFSKNLMDNDSFPSIKSLLYIKVNLDLGEKSNINVAKVLSLADEN